MCLGLLALTGACAEPNHESETAFVGSGIFSVSAASAEPDPTDTPTGAETQAGPTTSSGGDPGTTDEGDGATTSSSTSSTTLDLPASTGVDSSGADDGDECVGVRVEAKQKNLPVDILIVVDNSGSMSAENKEVQANLQEFADALASSALDFRLILISQYPVDKGDNAQIGICVEPPLGNGGCPTSDSKFPFLHVDHFVNSTTALKDILDNADLWHTTMRKGSRKHLMVVSDDNAAMSADEFHADLLKEFAEFPVLDGPYGFHAITGTPKSACDEIAESGSIYWALTQSKQGERSPGVLADLCEQDFDPVFTKISESIVDGASLSCTLELPDPGEGKVLDPDEVNVRLIVDEKTVDLFRVKDGFACGSAPAGRGWYYKYDLAEPGVPVAIEICGDACVVGQTPGAILELELGCKSVVPG
jgi:hypothetical protein